MAEPNPETPRRGRPKGAASFPWRALFQQSTTPLFVLGRHRRLRFANAAWERLAQATLAESLGMACSTRRHSSRLAAAMSPTPEALAGRPVTSRRPAPSVKNGPPWWDVTFVPLAGTDGPLGFVGFIEVVGEAEPAASRKLTPVVAAVRDAHARSFPLDLLAGETLAAGRLLAQARLAARSAGPYWLRGEPGSGKSIAARVIHHAGLGREKAFVALDCEGLQPHLLDSVLFGHGGLAATDRVGTIYWREPAALPRDFQKKLFDWLTDGRATTPRAVWASARPALDDVRRPAAAGVPHRVRGVRGRAAAAARAARRPAAVPVAHPRTADGGGPGRSPSSNRPPWKSFAASRGRATGGSWRAWSHPRWRRRPAGR